MKSNIGIASVLICFLTNIYCAQSLIINEISNGASGAKEYMEFLVVPGTIPATCTPIAPSCLDLREWVFDDNNGDHGPDGNAAGAIRFSQNALWQCVPVGTIIVIYNSNDIEASIPVNDLSIADGNFKIVIPISSNLLESKATSFTSIPCTYPATGWVATTTASWSQIALANGNDCARIVNPSGCEVFSVCYGSASLNPMIYFSGGAAQTVFSFKDGNPSLNSNWVSGNTSPSPGDQTPGVGNNVLNIAYVNGLRNLSGSTGNSISASASSTNASCTCSGSANASASGSVGPYIYQWLSASFVPIGQNLALASNLCAGSYNVIVTSNIGCKDTASVTITAPTNVANVTVSDQSMCIGSTATITAISTNTGGTYFWTPGGQTTSSITVAPGSNTTYSVSYSLTGCTGTAQGNVTVTACGCTVTTSNSGYNCATSTINLSATNVVGGIYSWSGPNGFTSSNQNPTNVSVPSAEGSYVFTVNVTSPAGNCTSSTTIVVTVPVIPIITTISPLCFYDPSITLSAIPSGGTWSGTGITDANSGLFDPSVANIGINSITYTTSELCPSSATLPIQVNEAPIGNFTADKTSGCSPLETDFSYTSSPPASAVLWNFGDGNTSSSLTNASHQYNNENCNTISLKLITAEGCSSVITKNNYICLSPKAEANFLFPAIGDINNPTIDFVNLSTSATAYSWIFDSLGSSTVESPSYTFTDVTGIYFITLIASNLEGCNDTLTQTISFEESLTYYIPNTFTPDGDANNNTFQPIFTSRFDPFQYNMLIFDRWGEILFETKDDQIGWDGSYQSRLMQDGIYVYAIRFKNSKNDKYYEVKGNVNLIR